MKTPLKSCSFLLGISLAFAQVDAQESKTAEPVATDTKSVGDAPEAVKPDKPKATTQAEKTDANAKQSRSANRADRLDLDTTIVTGNRELPKVLYIVPWKKAEIGDLPAQPFNTLLDEVLAPVDRDVFKREVKYFHTVTRLDAAAAPNAGETKDTSNTPR